jgi:hypothetical protein
VQKDDWICSQKCEKCYYEVCAGVTWRKQLRWLCSLKLSEQNSHRDEWKCLAIIDIPVHCITWYVL